MGNRHTSGTDGSRPFSARRDALTQHMLAADRLQVIENLVRERGSVRGSELAELLGVTDETVRRDLARLAELGIVRRAHGGAVAVRPNDETTTSVRLREHSQDKIAIGQRAADLVAPGTTIILDSGTTTLCLARALRGTRDIVVVTTAVTNALELVGNPGTTVIMTGGVIRPITYGTSGRLAAATLREAAQKMADAKVRTIIVVNAAGAPT